MQPTRLKLVESNKLVIEWNDGDQREYGVDDLRKHCPCATCRADRRKKQSEPPVLLPVVTPEEILPLTISTMQPVGNYAYSIEFSDGHNTGIFAMELLKTLGKSKSTE